MRSSCPSARLSRRQRNRFLCEALEPRVLLTGQTWLVTDTGNPTTNGTDLKNILNGTATQGGLHLELGDTIVLYANVTYFSTLAFQIQNVTAGTGTITIESSDIYNGLGHLTAGVRVGPSVAQYMPKITSAAGTTILKTQQNTGSGFIPAHNFTLLGIEIAPSGTQGITGGLLELGDNSTNQSSTAAVPSNFTIDRCYIHGYDDTGALANTSLNTNYKHGIALDCVNATIENSYVSDIHNWSQDSSAIGGANGMGNYTITNNFLEATGENILFGGADSFLGTGIDPANITITHNFLYKRLVWDPFDPSYLGVHMSVKNLLELKHATNVLVSDNLLENCWVGADQKGEGITLGPKDQSGGNTWALVHDVTITDNVIENVSEGFDIAGAVASDKGYTALPLYNVTIENNLVDTNSGGAGNGPGVGVEILGGNDGSASNLTIENNTFDDSNKAISLGNTTPFDVCFYGFTFTNNILEDPQYGLLGGEGEGTKSLNTFESGITMTNVGTGYTSAPTVTFSGGGGSGATGTALIINGTVYNIMITNNGSGYTSAPTITFGSVAGASGAAATSTIIGGQVKGWNFAGNIFYGNSSSSTTLYPSGNFFAKDADTTGFKDPAGQLDGLLSTSPYFTDGTGGSTPGVNMANLSGIADFTAVDAGLTGYWKFDEDTGTTTADSSGNGKTATLSSSTLWTTAGQSDNAIALTGGTSGSVSIPSFSTTSTFSFAAWINPASFSATQYIASAGNNAFSLSINTSGKLVATGTTGSVTASTAMTAGKWYLVGVTFNGTTLTVYQDGVAVGSVAATTTTGSTTLYLGGNKGSVSSLNGKLDEARYYNTNMSAININGNSGMLQLYNNFGPLVGTINPQGGNNVTTATSLLTSWAADHAAPFTGGSSAPSSLTFTWSLYSFNSVQGAGNITFSGATNGTNAAQQITVSWASGSGAYVIELTVTDAVGGSTTLLHPLNVTGLGTVPSAPSNVVATPSLSNITVTWTNTAGTNETGFDIQRFDSVSGDWIDLGKVGSSITSYTDTTVANDGTAYMYQVAAVNGAGDSDYVQTCDVACPIAYEGFNYTAGTWTGGNSGLGFASAWSVANTSNASVLSGSLAYSQTDGSGTHNLQTSGNKVQLTGTSASTTLSQTIGATGSSLWVGFDFSTYTTSTSGNLTSEVDLNGSAVGTGLRLGGPSTDHIGARVTIGTTSWFLTTSAPYTANTTNYVVFEVQYFTSGDVITAFVDPVPGVVPTSNNGTLTLPATAQLATSNNLYLFSQGATMVNTFDEIRLGLSYVAVAPDPLVAPVPTYTPAAITVPFLAIPTSLPTHAVFQSFLAATPIAQLQTLEVPLPPASDYHFQGDNSSTSSDPLNADDPQLFDVRIA